MIVLDASAVLAFLKGEPGADDTEAALEEGAFCSAANWSEVMQRLLAEGRDWMAAQALLAAYDFGIEPVTREDAEWAARRWRRGEALSLGDRLCLALGHRLGVQVWTTDRAWGEDDTIRQLR